MAKDGLKYFQADVGLYGDDKFILAQHIVDPDLKNSFLRFLVPHLAIRMLSLIFERGYYMEWNNEVALKTSSLPGISGGISLNNLKLLISALIECGFFDKEIYNSHHILTSHGIQSRWVFINRRLNRGKKSIIPAYCLLKKDINISKNNIRTSSEEMAKPSEEMAKPSEEMAKPSEEIEPLIITINKSIVDNTIKVSNKKNNKVIVINKKPSEEMAKPSEEMAKPSEEMAKPSANGYDGEIYKISNAMRILEHPLSVCMWNYLHNDEFAAARNSHYLRLPVHPDPEECERLIPRWADAFNRYLIGRGRSTASMSSGNDSWLTYFPNWVNNILASRGQINPDILFTKLDKGKGVHTKNEVFAKKQTDPEPGPDATSEDWEKWWRNKSKPTR